jgi:hypothetical protein
VRLHESMTLASDSILRSFLAIDLDCNLYQVSLTVTSLLGQRSDHVMRDDIACMHVASNRMPDDVRGYRLPAEGRSATPWVE